MRKRILFIQKKILRYDPVGTQFNELTKNPIWSVTEEQKTKVFIEKGSKQKTLQNKNKDHLLCNPGFLKSKELCDSQKKTGIKYIQKNN